MSGTIISLAEVRARRGLPAVAANTTPPATPGEPSDRALWEMMRAMQAVDPTLSDSMAMTRVLRAANRPRQSKSQTRDGRPSPLAKAHQRRDGSPRAPQRRPNQGQVAPAAPATRKATVPASSVPPVPEPATPAVPAPPAPPDPGPTVQVAPVATVPQPVALTASQHQAGAGGQRKPARAAQRTSSRNKRDKSRDSRKKNQGALSSYLAARVALLVLMRAGGIAFLILSSIFTPFGAF